MRIDILTLFPDMFKNVFEESIVKRAQELGKLEINIVNFRDYTDDPHKKVDDRIERIKRPSWSRNKTSSVE